MDTENKDYAWLLLSLVTVHVPVQDPHFVMEYFNTSIHMPEGVSNRMTCSVFLADINDTYVQRAGIQRYLLLKSLP